MARSGVVLKFLLLCFIRGPAPKMASFVNRNVDQSESSTDTEAPGIRVSNIQPRVNLDVGEGGKEAVLGRVRKTVVSSTFRLAFIMGLEGTGHHYMVDAITQFRRRNKDLPQIDDNFALNMRAYMVSFSMNHGPEEYAKTTLGLRERMEGLEQRARRLPWPGALQIQRGRWSYPSNDGLTKVFQYIDMRLMAEIAELQRVDFRVIYMRRSAQGLLVANTAHRDFQEHLGLNNETTTPEKRLMEYVKVIFTDMAVVHSLLGEIDPAFVVCHDWAKLGDAEQIKNISDFIAPTEEIGTRFAESMLTKAMSGRRDQELPFSGTETIIARLQAKLDAFEGNYCGPCV